jgi:hypothetical protein
MSDKLAPSSTEESAFLRMRGLRYFYAQAYYEAHEVWEDLWRTLPEQTDVEREQKAALQGLIQIAVGLTHWQRGNLNGAHRLLRKGFDKLSYCENVESLLGFSAQIGLTGALKKLQGRFEERI